ncbi:MAG: hypothetical protein HYU64_12110 [Armatimonadetes bacterium]|nr:hypothetical protein [Armatimonadota bacterium]
MVLDTVKLEYQMKKDEELSYKIRVNSQRETSDQGKVQTDKDVLTLNMTQKVVAVSSDGIYDLEMNVTPLELVRNSEPIKLEVQSQSVKLKMSRSGEILAISMPSPATQPSFPTKPLRKGESWIGESKINLPGKADPFILKFNYMLWGLEKVKGYECAQIQVSSPETKIPIEEQVTQKVSAVGTTYFAHKEGRLVKSDVETKTAMDFPGGYVKTLTQIFVELQEAFVPEAPADEEFIIKG